MSRYSNHPLYRKHDIDSAMDTLWNYYKSRFVPLFIISLVMSIAVQYITSTIDLAGLQTTTDPEAVLEVLKGMLPAFGIMMLVSFFFSVVLSHYILSDPGTGIKGIGTSFLMGFRYYIPYLLIMVLFTAFAAIAMTLGLFVFIIGIIFAAIYVMMISLFILPVLMAEGNGPAETISRTAILSHRSFWANIGWTTVFFLLVMVISLILSGLILIPFAGSFFKILTNPEQASAAMEYTKNPLFIILSSAVNAITTPLLPIFSFILYFNQIAREESPKIPVPATDEQRVRVEDLYAKPRPENMTDQIQQGDESSRV